MFLLQPLFLLLLLLPLFFSLYTFITTQKSIERYLSKEMLVKLSLNATLIPTKLRHRLFLLALCFFIVALARPVKEKAYLDSSESKSSLIIAIDASKSMYDKDIYPSRLTFALNKVLTFLEKSQHFNIGIIFYAQEAYMLYPLSQEPQLLHRLLKDANITQKFSDKTNLFAALEASQTLLKNHKNKHILLVSDGGANVNRDLELKYLQSHHITLHTLSLTQSDNVAMQTLCTQSGGLYQRYTWGEEDHEKLLKSLLPDHPRMQQYHYHLKNYTELYRYPLIFGLFLLLLLWLPGKRISYIPLFVLLSMHYGSTKCHAGTLNFWEDYQSIKHYNLATTSYHNKHYQSAIKLYTKALSEDKYLNAKIYHNIATAYVRTHKLGLAKRYYEKSLHCFILPQTQDNLAIVTQQLKIERKNLHKKYKKLYFKAPTSRKQNYTPRFTNYAVKIHTLLPDEEQRWFDKVLRHKNPLYLQKIPTQKRSLDANVSL